MKSPLSQYNERRIVSTNNTGATACNYEKKYLDSNFTTYINIQISKTHLDIFFKSSNSNIYRIKGRKKFFASQWKVIVS